MVQKKFCFNELPQCLVNSELYNVISNISDDNYFTMDSDNVVYFDEIESIEELEKIIDMLNYWQCNNIPNEVFMFIHDNQKHHEKELKEIIENTIFKEKLMALFHNDELLVIKAAKLGFLDLLKFAVYYYRPDEKNIKITSTAASYGKLDALKYLIEENFCFDEETTYGAALFGHLDVIKFLHEKENFLIDENTCAKAAEGGHLEIVKYLHENGCYWNEDTTNMAAQNGFINVLEYAYDNGCPIDDSLAMKAVYGGSVDCLDFAYKNGFTLDESILNPLIFTIRHEGIIKFFIERGLGLDSYVELSEIFAENGDLEMLKILHSHDVPLSDNLCSLAANGGRLDVLEYCFKKGCPLTEEACENAASGEYIEILEYLHENGCPWNEETCIKAIGVNSLDCLAYAHENGCPWTEKTFWAACENYDIDCLKYVHENGCPYPKVDDLINFSTFGKFSKKCFEYIVVNIYPDYHKQIF